MMLDKEFFDTVMKSAGVGAAIGWIIQFYVWREEKTERKELTKFIMEQLVTITTEKAVGTASITTLTTAVNALMSIVKGGKP